MKKVLVVMIAVAFCLSFVGMVAAVDVVKQPVETMQQFAQGGSVTSGAGVPVLYKFLCPTGWTKKANTPYTCVPSKPAPIHCPAGYQYYEYLNCTAGMLPGGGNSPCAGCEVGCFKIPT